MRENNYKPQIPDVMEAIFDAGVFDFCLSCRNFIFYILTGKYVIYSLWNINIDTLWRRCFSSGAKNYKGSTRK